MASKTKLTKPPVWNKHLRPEWKGHFWKNERLNVKNDIRKSLNEI